MKTIKYTIVIFITFLLIDCATTRMTSFVDPDYNEMKFNRILVLAMTGSLEDTQHIETELTGAFSDVGVFALEGSKLFPPTRTFTNEERAELLSKNSIDAILVVSVGETGVSEVYIPQTSSTNSTKGKVNVHGNTATYREKSKTTYQGGYTLQKPWAEIQIKLFDVTNGKTAWIATSFTGGNAYANKNTVINSFSSKTIEKLIEDNLIMKISQK